MNLNECDSYKLKNNDIIYMTNKKIQKGGNESLAITNGPVQPTQSDKQFVPVKRIPYDIQIFSFLCILGIIFRIIFARTSKDYATATIWGYGFSLLALCGLIISSFAISNKNQYSQGILGFLKTITANSLPIIFTLVIIALIVIQNISFYNQINTGKVADEYYSFSGVSAFLILVQVSLVINFLLDKLKQYTSDKGSKADIMAIFASELNSIILILSVTNFAFIGMLQVILKYFSTDG